MPDFRVAIVGTGLAGLTLAHHLHQHGLDVTVYERDPDLITRNPLSAAHQHNRNRRPRLRPESRTAGTITADTYCHLLPGVGQHAAEAAARMVPRRRRPASA